MFLYLNLQLHKLRLIVNWAPRYILNWCRKDIEIVFSFLFNIYSCQDIWTKTFHFNLRLFNASQCKFMFLIYENFPKKNKLNETFASFKFPFSLISTYMSVSIDYLGYFWYFFIGSCFTLLGN